MPPPLFSLFKILKGILPGRCLPVRGVLSCPREISFPLSRARDSIGFYLSLAVTQNIKKLSLAQKKACLPSACPLLARCRLLACPRLSAPPRWFETLWGGEVRGERRWEGGKRHPHQKNAHTIKPGVLVPLTASLEGDRATHTDEDGYRVLQILGSTLPRLSGAYGR